MGGGERQVVLNYKDIWLQKSPLVRVFVGF